MKNFVFFVFLTQLSTGVSAQLSGEISYLTKVNVHRSLPDDERGQRMKEWIPEFTEFKTLLLFSQEQTLYKNVQEEAVDLSVEEEGGWNPARMRQHMMARLAPPNDVIYTDVTKGHVTLKKEFMDKIFLIRDTLTLSNWKLTGDQMSVSGFSCLKAEYLPKEGDTNMVSVWFTPEIPVSSGPAGYGGLPGLIVHLNINDGGTVITLAEMVMRELVKGEIDEPKKGKEITQEEFDAMVEKKKEQQRQQWQGGGGHAH